MLGVFLDTETTGLDPLRHHPIEIAFKVVDLLTGDVKETFESKISLSEQAWGAGDHHAQLIHALTFEELKTAPTKEMVGKTIIHILRQQGIVRGQGLFICQNPSFDKGFFNQLVSVELQEELEFPYHWLDLASMYWTRVVRDQLVDVQQQLQLHHAFYVSKDQIAKQMGLAPEKKPHRAMQGVLHLLACYEKVVGFPQKRA